VLIVHPYGMPADIDAFAALCRDRGIALVEDAACAIGSALQGAAHRSAHRPCLLFLPPPEGHNDR
jgi:dTDP-4-amino-4,6-dideoxygalactose transaminase